MDRSDTNIQQPGKARRRINSHLLDLAMLLIVTTPGYIRMRSHPELEGWADDLVAFSQREELRPLEEPLKTIAAIFADGPQSFIPMFESLKSNYSKLGLANLMAAARISAENRKDRPYASLMLAWTALCAWIIQADESGLDLYSEDGPNQGHGWPNPGWRDIPAACIEASLQLHGIHGAALFAAEAHAVLRTNARRHPEHSQTLEPTIAKYHHLARTLANRFDMATAGLADDLHDACCVDGRARRLVAALLWTMGLVPESCAVRKNTAPAGRALLLRLIRSSFHVLARDPLVQYLWLEMKEAPELDLRFHDSLYAVLNHNWCQWSADETYELLGLSAEPSRLFGRALECLLAGDLDESLAGEFLQAYDMLSMADLRIISGTTPAFIVSRFSILRHLIGERFDYFKSDYSESQKVEWFMEQVMLAARKRKVATMIPQEPDAGARTGIAMHETIERLLVDDSKHPADESERCTLTIDTLESFRTGALSYWLNVIPPGALKHPDNMMENLLEQERQLIDRMRGAYYLALRPTLPMHTQWCDMDMSIIMDLRDPEFRTNFYSQDRAREEMNEIEALLAGVADQMLAVNPVYAESRRQPYPGMVHLSSMLGHHRLK